MECELVMRKKLFSPKFSKSIIQYRITVSLPILLLDGNK
jgi:hypothetical protein